MVSLGSIEVKTILSQIWKHLLYQNHNISNWFDMINVVLCSTKVSSIVKNNDLQWTIAFHLTISYKAKTQILGGTKLIEGNTDS